MERFRMELESLSKNEEFARVVVTVFMSRLDPTLEEIDDVKTAVSEAVTNAEIHGYGGEKGAITVEVETEGKELTVEVEIEGREVTVVVEDYGIGIRDVEKAMEPMFTTDKTGTRSGMGFSFMEAFMDQVHVESEPGKGTKVVMRKQIGR